MKRALSRKNLWTNLPWQLKSFLAPMVRVVPLDLLLGQSFRQEKNMIREADGWRLDQIREYQLNRLSKLLSEAYKNSPYFRKKFDQLGVRPSDCLSFPVFETIPTMTKSDVSRHLGDLLLRSKEAVDVDYITTGGTGGIPFGFYINSGRSAVEYAYLLSGWARAGYRPTLPKAVFRGRVVPKTNRSLPNYEYDPILNEHHYSSFHLSDENILAYLKHIRTLAECYLHIYPSTAYLLARYLRKNDIKAPTNIIGILAESEIVYPEQRAFVEDVFGCAYFSSYGHTEKLVAAAECELSNDYHMWPTYGYAELLDDEGRAIREQGAVGEIVGTGFINNVMAFIRYRTGDYAEFVGEKCDYCGRAGLIVRNIRGHNVQEFLVRKDRSLIPWAAMNMHDDTFDNVRQFQFFQITPGRVTIRIVPHESFSDLDVEKIQKNVAQKFDDSLVADIQLVDKIEITDRGKSVFVDQRINLDLKIM